MRMMRNGTALALVAWLCGGGAALAQSNPQVTLRSFDGFTQLRGELMNFDGQTYTLRTRLGTLQIDALQVSCEGESCPDDLLFGAQFAVRGSDSVAQDLMPALVEGYADTLGASLEREVGQTPGQQTFRVIHPDGEEMAAIDLASADAGATFASLASGEAAIALSSTRIDEDNAGQFLQAGLPDPRNTENEVIAALDGLLVVVHPSNPVRAISLFELAQIYAGEITSWSQLGGPDMAITAYGREDGSGPMSAFDELVMIPNGYSIAGGIERLGNDADLSDSVASDVTGIGLTPFAYRRAAKALAIRQDCGIVSEPSEFSIKTEEYPLSRRLYLYGGGEDIPSHARRLLAFAQSDDASPFIRDAGFVSLAAGDQGLGEQGLRLAYALTEQQEFSLQLMQEMLRDLDGARRLSTTFRFTPGSSQLTAKSQTEAEALAEAIANGEYNGQTVMLVGFTDSIGQFELNRALSERRAQGVLFTMAEAVSAGQSGQFGGATIEVRGYGEMTPVGCNTSFAGRVANRRVEVWVR